jgi:phosphopentomutase
MVAYKKNCKAKYIGDLIGFHNVASSISDYFGLENIFPGNSFLNDI